MLIFLFVLTGSAFIDTDTCPTVWLKIVCDPYTNRTYGFLPLKDWWRSWQGLRLGVHYCWQKSISLLNIKSPSSSLPKNYFVGCWPVYFLFNGLSLIDAETCPWLWLHIVCGPYKFAHTDFPDQKVCGRLWRGCWLCHFTCYNKYIEWM